jgi:hypothetical protein
MSDLTIAAHSQSGNITENHTENIIFLKQQTKLVIPNHSWENINIQLESLLNITCPMSLFEKGDPSACLSKLYETIQTIFHEKSVKSNPVKPKVKPQKSKFQEVKILTDLLNSDSVDIDMKNEIKNRLEFLEKELNNNTELINKAKSQKELESNCRKFENDPWQYGKNLFSNSNTKLNCTDDELIKHYSEILQTNCPPEPLSSTTPIGPQSPTPTEPLNLEPFCSGDIENFLKRKTKHSAPGPNGIPYSIWRNCPVTHKYLVHIFNSIMTRGEVPKEWKLGITKPIPKSENSKASETRPITMTNTDAKIFFGLMAERLDTFLSTNNLVDKRVQKGFAKGIPGCIEHSSLLLEALFDASWNKKNICATFIDLKNAFGSVRHEILPAICKWFHLPESFTRIVESYYQNLHCQILLQDKTLSDPLKLNIGLFQGCTLSVYLFLIVFQVFLNLLKTDKCLQQSYNFKSCPHLSVKELAFADDLLFVTKSPEGAQYLLKILDSFLNWSKMEVNESKCKYLAFKHRKTQYDHITDRLLKVNGKSIEPLQTTEHYKYLGINITPKLTTETDNNKLKILLNEGLKKIDGQKLTGFQKIWLYNHFLIPKMSWILMMVHLSNSFVNSLQKTGQKLLKSWAGIPRSGNAALLYTGHVGIGMKCKNIVIEYKKLKTIKSALLKTSNSNDKSIYLTRSAENNRLHNHESVDFDYQIINSEIETNRHGLGYKTPKITNKDERKKVASLVHEREIDKLIEQTSSLAFQGKWATWKNIMENDIKWQSAINSKNENLLKFLINSTLNTLPTKDNLRRWGTGTNGVCDLCGLTESLKHVLNCCSFSLNQGRYKWRHNKILSTIFQAIVTETQTRKNARYKNRAAPFIFFHKEGEPVPRMKTRKFLIKSPLDEGNWTLTADLRQSENTVQHELNTILPNINGKYIPDIFLHNSEHKKVIIGELTCPWEDNIRNADNNKATKYSKLVKLLQNSGYSVDLKTFSIGSRGYVSKSFQSFLTSLGISITKSKKICKLVSQLSILSSYTIYCHRNSHVWNDFGILQEIE